MEIKIDSRYPSIDILREKAKKKIPGFAFDYLDGGCNSNANLQRNTSDIRKVFLKPYYIGNPPDIDLSVDLFGHKFSAPFGVAPIGLQGLIWPGAPKILAEAAKRYNVPFILSTVSTEDIETIMKINEKAWFQLYYPQDENIRNGLVKRCADNGVEVLVALADVPSFGYRPKEIKNGLAIPPKITLNNMIQICTRPHWALSTLLYGQPAFKNLLPYMPGKMSLKHLGLFMNKTFDGRLNEERLKQLRDQWKGKLVVKGVTTEEDVQKCIDLGMDGIIISNHGGRQLDAAESTISSLKTIAPGYKDKITIMADSGMRMGPDIANMLAHGAEMTFLGRAFMYSVGALGENGGTQAMSILKRELEQVMQQVCCKRPENLKNHLILQH
jgi:L-lactate dehydrogenase (cytochrome)